MKLLKSVLIIIFLLGLAVQHVSAQNKISSYNVDIQIQADGTVQVREIFILTIEEDWFEFPFVRTLPRYFIMGDGYPQAANYKVMSVVMDNQSMKYHTTMNEEFLYINIGDKTQELSQGNYRIVLEYSMPNIIQYSSRYDYLDWQAIVNRNSFPITKSRIRVHLPKEAILVTQGGMIVKNAEQIRSVKFRQFSAGKYYTTVNETMNENDYVKFNLGWQKGIVKEVSFNQKTLRLIMRYPVYFVYTFLLLIYVVSFIYLFTFSARKDVLKLFQRFSPSTLYAFDHGEFNYKCILLALIRMAGLGAITIIYQEGKYILNLRTHLRLQGIERKLYDILQTNGKGHYVQLSDFVLSPKDWFELAKTSATELNLPKAEYQKYFFGLTFSLSFFVLLHTFGRYDSIFCLAVLYILFVIPLTLQYYSMQHIPFKLPSGKTKLHTHRYKIYVFHFIMVGLLYWLSLDELDYFLFRAPEKDYEIFKIIGILNYANVILYALQIQRHLVQIRTRTVEFKEYFLDPFNMKFKESNRLYNAERLFSHYLPYAMIYNSEKVFAEYCSQTFIRAGGDRYQIKWFKLDGDFEGSFEGVSRYLARDFMLNLRAKFNHGEDDTEDDED